MEREEKTEDDQSPNGAAGNCDPIGETASCEEQEKVDDGGNNLPFAADHISCGEDEADVDRNLKDAPCNNDSRRADERGISMSHLTSSVEALRVSGSHTLDEDLDRDSKQETGEEDRLEGAVGQSCEEVLGAGATVSNDEKALTLYKKSNTEDTDDEDEDESSKEEDIKTCFSCGKERQVMKKCGACRHATYCDRTCQKADWKRRHKKSCGNYQKFLAQINQSDILKYQLMHGPLQVRMSMEFFKNPIQALFASALPFGLRRRQFVLLKIVAKYPHFFRPGCFVQDVYGNQTHILFYTGPLMVRLPLFPIPMPLESLLTPGKFIWLVDPVWHSFLDGTVGIRIDHPDQFELP